jgi:hypothetical protein
MRRRFRIWYFRKQAAFGSFYSVYTPCKPKCNEETHATQIQTTFIYSSSSSSSASIVVAAIPMTIVSINRGLIDSLKLTVQITLSTLGDATASLLLVLLQNTNFLKSLHNLAVYASAGIDMVGWAGATVAGGAVDFAKAADTDGFAEIDVTGDSGSANIEPVD